MFVGCRAATILASDLLTSTRRNQDASPARPAVSKTIQMFAVDFKTRQMCVGCLVMATVVSDLLLPTRRRHETSLTKPAVLKMTQTFTLI